MQAEQMHYQHHGHGEGPLPGYALSDPADFTYTSHPSSHGSMSIPTFWNLMPSQSFLPAQLADDDQQSGLPQIMPNYDTYHIYQQPQLICIPPPD